MARKKSESRALDTQINAQAGPSSAGSSGNPSFAALDIHEGVEVRRQSLLKQRQAELEKVLDKHDDLIREAFHLERFVSLLYYDPLEAKKDRSAVFEAYKLKHDLVLNTPGAGPSRTTRRAQNERVSTLQARPQRDLPPPPVQPRTAPPRRLANGAASQPSMSISAGTVTNDLRRNSSNKGLSAVAKGKQKESISDEESGSEVRIEEHAHNSHRSRGKGNYNGRQYFPRTSRSQSVISEDFSSRAGSISQSGSQSRRAKQIFKEPLPPSPSTAGFGEGVRFRKKSYSKMKDPKPPLQRTSSGTRLRITIPASPEKKSEPSRGRPTVSGKTLPGTSSKRTAIEPPPAFRLIKRVKLIVREPPPTISSPQQKPPPPQFGKSLSAFLSSYRHVDGKDYDEAGFEKSVRQRVRLLRRIDRMKRDGRLLLDPDTALALRGLDEHGARTTLSLPTISTAGYRPDNIWSIVISDAIAARNTLSRHKFGRGGVVAASIEAKIQAYWNSQRNLGQREALAEEKRLRALAKSTLRLVLAEWKKVIFHVREEERLRREAEEKRLGRQHLDAILDQSGQILEKQQLELHRTDVLRDLSRSVSASGEADEDGEDETEEEADGEEPDSADEAKVERGSEAEDDESVASSDSEEEVGLSALITGPPTLQADAGTVIFDEPLNDVAIGDRDADEFGSQHSSVGDDMDISDDDTQGQEGPQGEDEAEMNAIVDIDQPDSASHSDWESHDLGESQSRESQEPLEALQEVTSQESSPRASFDATDSRSRELLRLAVEVAEKSASSRQHLVDEPEREESHENSPTPTVDVDSSLCDVVPTPPSLRKATISASLMHAPSEQSIGATLSQQPVRHTASKMVVEEKVQGDKVPNGTSADVSEDHRGVEEQPTPNALNETTKSLLGQGVLEVEEGVRVNGAPNSEDEESAQSAEVVLAAHKEEFKSEVRTGFDLDWKPSQELRPYAVARVEWHPEDKLKPPLLLRGSLRPYQQSGLEWLAALHNNNMNGILADEMGLGKTIQTIALLAHLACDRGIWGPHLIIVPTSVLLNWEMEFKKFLPGFKILSYHGSTKRRKELRKGWNDKYAFNVCVTSYTLASRDEHILKRKAWYYMILDEAHMIKNFKSQRWNILLLFKSVRRLLLTGTPLQNNLTELWALLQFLMSGTKFANLKEFGEWFSNPLEKAIEQGNIQDQEVQARVMKLHTVLRPYLLRRLKRDVEKELPSKYEHLVLCRLSKRQRFLYDEFMSRSQTREDLRSGVYQKIANILMQLRKVCNHPDLFEVRPIVTSFAMERSAIADFEIKELLIRCMLLEDEDLSSELNLDLLGLRFVQLSNTSIIGASSALHLKESLTSDLIAADPGEPPPYDLRTIEGFRKYKAFQRRWVSYLRWSHMSYLNQLKCRQLPVYAKETIDVVKRLYNPLTADCEAEFISSLNPLRTLIKSHSTRAYENADIIDRFAFATPAVVARDLPSIALCGVSEEIIQPYNPDFDASLHKSAVKLQIAFPDVTLLQYDCGKLQELAELLRERKAGGHRVLIFTQMTRILDILEIFLNFHGYLYLRLDGATKIEDRQYITERFNVDERIFAFIASSRSGGVGINLTGADTVIFYDSDFNPQMDRQCEDRAHRIGQIRDVHIYRFVSQYTVEEAMLRKANQKRSLDDIVIQQGEFDWRNFFNADHDAPAATELQKALVEFEDFEDAYAAKVAANEEAVIEGEDRADFGDADAPAEEHAVATPDQQIPGAVTPATDVNADGRPAEEDEEGGTTIDYMLSIVRSDPEFFREWRL